MARVGADPLTLQARMACRCGDDRHISGSWQFGLSLHFDSENGHWRADHPGGGCMEKWDSDRAVTDFLKKVSMETVGPAAGFHGALGGNVEDHGIFFQMSPVLLLEIRQYRLCCSS